MNERGGTACSRFGTRAGPAYTRRARQAIKEWPYPSQAVRFVTKTLQQTRSTAGELTLAISGALQGSFACCNHG